MARILILSSLVARGHVGLSAAAPALQALGHEVTQLPTTMLSNHPGWPHVAGSATPCGQLSAMIDALDANGWLQDCDTVLTGYLPTPDHVDLAAALVRRVCTRKPAPRVVVDPVLGDAPRGLYLPRPVAEAVRDRLVPLADVLTPNLFELCWLAGQPAETPQEAAGAARALLRRITAQDILVTSAPAPGGRVATLSITHHAGLAWSAPYRDAVPHGVGDVFSALIAAGLPTGTALGHLAALIDESIGAPHLRIAESAAHWTSAAPLPPKTLTET